MVIRPQDYRFKELRKIDFGDAGVNGRDERFSLLCTSNHFGLTFVGCKTGQFDPCEYYS